MPQEICNRRARSLGSLGVNKASTPRRAIALLGKVVSHIANIIRIVEFLERHR